MTAPKRTASKETAPKKPRARKPTARAAADAVASAAAGGKKARPARTRRDVSRLEMAGTAITHPEKVLFPDDGITKGELAAYYEAIAPLMLPHLRGRPVTMERFPSGIGEEGFLHKNLTRGFPAWIERVETPKNDGTVNYLIVNDVRSLIWMTNQNTITPHVWISRVPDLFHPDMCLFDLDPSEDNPDVLRAAVLAVRDFLADLGLKSWVKTSGSKGFHVIVPLDRTADMGEVARFAHAAGTLIVRNDPDHLTQEFSKADRGRRILVDTGRNGYSATVATAYAVRPKPGAPVSAPCTWEEVERGDAAPRSFTLRSMAARVAEVGDPWADMLKHGQSLRGAIDAIGKLRE
jgi:bifunctional non-homologous end joining protein LigD